MLPCFGHLSEMNKQRRRRALIGSDDEAANTQQAAMSSEVRKLAACWTNRRGTNSLVRAESPGQQSSSGRPTRKASVVAMVTIKADIKAHMAVDAYERKTLLIKSALRAAKSPAVIAKLSAQLNARAVPTLIHLATLQLYRQKEKRKRDAFGRASSGDEATAARKHFLDRDKFKARRRGSSTAAWTRRPGQRQQSSPEVASSLRTLLARPAHAASLNAPVAEGNGVISARDAHDYAAGGCASVMKPSLSSVPSSGSHSRTRRDSRKQQSSQGRAPRKAAVEALEQIKSLQQFEAMDDAKASRITTSVPNRASERIRHSTPSASETQQTHNDNDLSEGSSIANCRKKRPKRQHLRLSSSSSPEIKQEANSFIEEDAAISLTVNAVREISVMVPASADTSANGNGHQGLLIPKDEPTSPRSGPCHSTAAAAHVQNDETTLLFAPEAAVSMAAEIACWMQTAPDNELCFYTLQNQLDVSATLRENCLRFYRDLFVNDDAAGRRRLLEQLLEVRPLPLDYPNKDLRRGGHRGVFARQRISADTVFGLYSGVILKDGNPEAKSRDLAAELCYLNGIESNMFDTADTLSKYAYQLPLCSSFANQQPDTKLMISALQRGNSLCLINGFRRQDGLPVNTKVEYVRAGRNVPVILLVAATDIAQDDELILDYGATYFAKDPEPVMVEPGTIADIHEMCLFNRFTRVANSANDDFVLPVKRETLADFQLQLLAEGINRVSVCGTPETLTLSITSAAMFVAVEQQKRIPAPVIPDNPPKKKAKARKKL